MRAALNFLLLVAFAHSEGLPEEKVLGLGFENVHEGVREDHVDKQINGRIGGKILTGEEEEIARREYMDVNKNVKIPDQSVDFENQLLEKELFKEVEEATLPGVEEVKLNGSAFEIDVAPHGKGAVFDLDISNATHPLSPDLAPLSPDVAPLSPEMPPLSPEMAAPNALNLREGAPDDTFSLRDNPLANPFASMNDARPSPGVDAAGVDAPGGEKDDSPLSLIFDDDVTRPANLNATDRDILTNGTDTLNKARGGFFGKWNVISDEPSTTGVEDGPTQGVENPPDGRTLSDGQALAHGQAVADADLPMGNATQVDLFRADDPNASRQEVFYLADDSGTEPVVDANSAAGINTETAGINTETAGINTETERLGTTDIHGGHQASGYLTGHTAYAVGGASAGLVGILALFRLRQIRRHEDLAQAALLGVRRRMSDDIQPPHQRYNAV